ncbi:MAG TPA: flagellin [Clostridia bacterium]|nr:flagellin [Clostridia bacterium]
MRINHNIASLNTYRQLSANGTNSQKSIEKLSSGLRINRAGDDAAGLAISEKMRGQIRGLDQASRNAQDGISLIQTAEGALNETHSILQRMRELSVQSANDTNTADDRKEIQKEIEQLKSEVNRISETTEFNTQKLLNGSLGSKGNSANAATLDIVSTTGLKTGTYNVTVDTAATQTTYAGGANATDAAVVAGAGDALVINGVSIDTTGLTTVAGLRTLIDSYSDSTGVTTTAGTAGSAALELTAVEYGSTVQIDLSGSHADWLASAALGTGGALSTAAAGADAVVTFTSPDAISQTVTGVGRSVVYQSAEFSATAAVDASATTFTVTSAGATLQIGANKDQAMLVDMNEMSTLTLGDSTVGFVKDINVQTQTGANDAIEAIDKALAQVSGERSKLGAFQNRLEHTINNLGTSSENLTAAESRVRDVDMAKEMMEFTKNNILSQAAQAMLAQANQQPQGVLQLLR